jgi:HAD superfamily hydrolase (TIGR01490 family)
MPRAAAFFDLDRTLMAGSSGMAWVRASYDAKLISRAQMLRWARDGLVFRLRGSTDEKTKAAMDQISEVLKGTSGRDLERLGPQVLAGVLPRIYPEMLREVHAHQDAGRPTFIVSAAGNDLVEMVARVLGMEGGIGTRYELDGDGLFTGRLDGPFMYGKGKLEGIAGFADSHDIDLAESWAYSDSASDLPMLRAVGNAVVVNPDTALLAGDAVRKARTPPRDRGRDAHCGSGRRRLGPARPPSCGCLVATASSLADHARLARRSHPQRERCAADVVEQLRPGKPVARVGVRRVGDAAGAVAGEPTGVDVLLLAHHLGPKGV